ncbi:uncharacterized protein LOC111378428 [Olea europaea var. sylvestris]|uniref:uncharacterized protein LOC111378428 n=1 Tax=Olea europaea var. sylvestris TaxID=158386 RepID=UPI000C1D81ED|nr:uncharacterized protein LOC111378428 [Olea europaea var. sylvestris]
MWRTTLVGSFVGKKLAFPVVNSIAHKLWGKFGLQEVLSSDAGFYFFKFDSLRQALLVLEGAPWHMANRPLILKRWEPNMTLAKENLRCIPVWVKLYNIPFEYWTTKGLSHVASAVGRPLRADVITLTCKRLSYARVCVEINALDELVEEFDFRCANGDWITIRAEFEWVPIKCSKCGVFGHNCSSQTMPSESKGKLAKIWVAKDKAGQSGVANEKPPIEDEWTHVSHKSGVANEKPPIEDEWTHVSHKRKSIASVDNGVAVPISKEVQGEVDLVVANVAHEVSFVPIETSQIGEEGEVSPDPLATLDEDDSDTSVPQSNTLAMKARDSLQKKKNGSRGKHKKGKKHHSPRGVETKVKEKNQNKVGNAIFNSWSVLSNYNCSPIGRIWVCWNPIDVDVLLVGCSAQAIHVRVNACNGKWSCVVSVVYGDNIPVKRVDLWDDFIARYGGFAHLPWVVMGDFNSVVSPSEVAGGSSSWPAWQDDLGNCMTTVGLADLKFDGCLYTWSNKQVSDPTLKKLDRVLVNSKWEEEFSGSSATFLTAGVSDHLPMVVKVAELPRRKIPFRFFDYWMDHSDFFPLVAQVWGESVVGTPMFCLCSKLKKLKLALKDFNKEHFSELPTRVTQARIDIEHVQCLIQQSPLDSSLHREEARLQKKLYELSRAEEGFLRQKARVKWLNLGDQNTAFFFKAMKSHYGKSKVVSICKDDGTRVEELHAVSEVIVAFYQNLLGQ